MRRLARIYGLNAFGLNAGALRRLGTRSVTVEITVDAPPYIYPSRLKLQHLLQMTLSERHALVRQWLRKKYAALRKELPFNDLEVVRLNMALVGIRLALPAKSIERLRRFRNADTIRICSIKGIRVKNSTHVRSRLYAVTGRMVFQVEGQTPGTQLCEERITFVTARSKRDARARVARTMNEESNPYLLVSGHFARWSFEGITDVCECPDKKFSSKSTEVFYRYRKRRVNAKNAWHPMTDK